MLDRRRRTAALVLVLALTVPPGVAAAGPLTSGAVAEDGFLSSWLGWLADGWRALAGAGEAALGSLRAPSGVGIDPNGGGGPTGGTTGTSPAAPTAQDGSISTAQ